MHTFPFKATFTALSLALTCSAFGQGGTTTEFCDATPNSTGLVSSLSGSFGTGVGSDLHLEVTQGVPNEIGFFLAGNEATAGVPIGNGLLCLVGTGTARLYRYVIPGGTSNSIGRFDSFGVLQNLAGTSQTGTGFDVPGTIPGGVPIAIMSGDTWHFQFWHRDTAVLPSDSNLSNALSVTFGAPTVIPGMQFIPSGTFMMGSNVAPGAPYFGEASTRPAHSTTVSNGFWMAQYEVTQTEYESLMGSSPSLFLGRNKPVEQVSWLDASAYCSALTAQELALGNMPSGHEYRLPTEAEWEYAARAGTTSEFSIGTNLFCGDASFQFSYHDALACSSNSTADVGSYAPNAWGLYDMSGNVWEWCLDSYSGYSASATTNPFTTGSLTRIIRGGSWDDRSNYCRSAARIGVDSSDRYSTVGFRVVLANVLNP